MDVLAPIHSSILYWGTIEFPVLDVDIEKVDSAEELKVLASQYPFKVFDVDIMLKQHHFLPVYLFPFI